MVSLITDDLLTRRGGSVRNAKSIEKELCSGACGEQKTAISRRLDVLQNLCTNLLTELLRRNGVKGNDSLHCGPGIAGVYLHLLGAKLLLP